MAIDVAAARERDRRRRLIRLSIGLAPLAIWLWWRLLTNNPISPGLPELGADAAFYIAPIAIVLLIALVLIGPMLGNGRSPHTIYLPEQIEVGFSDVKGLGSVMREVEHTLYAFLNHEKLREEMGASPRRGVLFEGPPGTGKTHIAKAMAKEAGVPFLFVSSTAFQSMWYGATARKIRSYFRQLRKVARREGGAIGFIEEIDAIATKRGGMNFTPAVDPATESNDEVTVVNRSISQGTGGVVNELLVQMQSFDEPTRPEKFKNVLIRFYNRFLPAHRQVDTIAPSFANILLIGATNRADSLDPALLRPGRFDRIFSIDVPGLSDRRELVDYFLDHKAHDADLDADLPRERVAATTQGYTPAAIERLFDEALLVALREGRNALTAGDLAVAKMEVEIGLPNPADYTEDERRRVATHESGHAVIAYLAGKGRRLEVLSIIKRRGSLGLLAHRDTEERFTRTESEMKALIQIALGGMVAEETFFGESGTGPGGDLQAATQTAVDMVGSYGLGDSLISLRALDNGAFGGNLVSKVLADKPSRSKVDQILKDAKHLVQRLITDHRYLVEALRDALLDREELIDEEIIDVLTEAEAEALASGRVVVDLRSKDGRFIETAPRPSDIKLQPQPFLHE